MAMKNGEILNEKKKILGKRSLDPNVKSFDKITIEELLYLKKNHYGVPDQEKPDFFSMTTKSDFYYIIRNKMEMAQANTNGHLPKNFHKILYTEIRKNYFMLLMDICGVKIIANDIANTHKFQFDKVLKSIGAYEYYSPNVGNHFGDNKL